MMKVTMRRLDSKEVQGKSDEQLKKNIVGGTGKTKPVKALRGSGPRRDRVRHELGQEISSSGSRSAHSAHATAQRGGWPPPSQPPSRVVAAENWMSLLPLCRS